MTKLNKQYYYSKNNEKKINCYHIIVTKKVIQEAGIEDDDELTIYEEYGEIIIKKKYHLTCMECGYEWDSGKEYNIQTACPRCKIGDIHCDINGGNNEYPEQAIKQDA